MQRREFSQAAGALIAATALSQVHAQAASKGFVAGTDYLVLDRRAPVDALAGQIEVVEFFWYNCAHCSAFEPEFAQWIKKAPKGVVVRRVPVAFRPDFEPQQRLFYALEAMGKVEQLHAKVFHAIHVDKQELKTVDAISAWVEKQGVNKAQFLENYNSFSIAAKAKKSTQLQDTFKVDGVPALGVAGRFYTSGTLAQNMQRALAVTDFLITLARKTK